MIEIPPSVRGLIFDCDGTIADTMPLHYVAWLTALGPHASDFPEDVFYGLAGMPTADIVRLLNDRHGHRMPPQETAEHKDRLFQEVLSQVLPIEPVVQLIHRFRGRLPMAVASGGTRDLVTRTIEAIGLSGVFQAVVTADDVPNGKPAPDIFLEAARRLGVDPTLCYAFEDGELGLISAKAAGMVAVDIRPAHQQARAASARAAARASDHSAASTPDQASARPFEPL